jgi:segregation and condensation protein A
MSKVLVALEHERYVNFVDLFDPSEGRMGVTVTFLALLELLKESLIDVVQAEPYGPIHVRSAQASLQNDESTQA